MKTLGTHVLIPKAEFAALVADRDDLLDALKWAAGLLIEGSPAHEHALAIIASHER